MIIVSGCLLGIPCKYDGGTNLSKSVRKYLENKSYVMICPETMAGLTAPRPPAEIVGDKVVNREGVDVTESFRLGAQKAWELASEKAKEKRAALLYNLAEEMADTLIIISELQAIWGIDDNTIQDIIDFKQARTKKRITEDWRTK